MRVAVVGAGVAGLAAAYELQKWAHVTVFEARNRLGGHTDTHAILAGDRTYSVDAGFMAFDAVRSPGFSAWLDELGVASQAAELSLGVDDLVTGLQYGTHSARALLCQPRKLCSPRFVNLLRDLARFYLRPPAVASDDPRSLGAFLEAQGFSLAFRELHLRPVCRALWSMAPAAVDELPAADVIGRLVQHRLLPVGTRPDWRVIQGGAGSYVDAFVKGFAGRIRCGEPVQAIVRQPGQVLVATASGRQAFDAVVLACHSYEALALLQDPVREEREILGALRFQRGRRVMHSDPGVMPRNRNVWSSWNARLGGSGDCEITFWMNGLLSLPDDTPLFVTLDPAQLPDNVWSIRDFAAPVQDDRSRAARHRRNDISGRRNTWYCGAWWGNGLQEDGFASGIDVARALARQALQAA